MVKFRKKLTICIIIIFVIITLSGCTTINDGMRLRIVANSDNEIDQSNKLKVKEVVKRALEADVNISCSMLLQKIKSEINEPFVNTIKVEYTNETFPAKSYKGEFIPSGTYPTLLITIGKGEGKNFWTLLYPEFFNISFEDDNEIEYRCYVYDKFMK